MLFPDPPVTRHDRGGRKTRNPLSCHWDMRSLDLSKLHRVRTPPCAVRPHGDILIRRMPSSLFAAHGAPRQVVSRHNTVPFASRQPWMLLYDTVVMLRPPSDVVPWISFLVVGGTWLLQVGLSYRTETHLILGGTGWHILSRRPRAQGLSWMSLLGRGVEERLE